jgi:hypothetical protein
VATLTGELLESGEGEEVTHVVAEADGVEAAARPGRSGALVDLDGRVEARPTSWRNGPRGGVAAWSAHLSTAGASSGDRVVQG